jgi:tetratricopeptide (TPR) repeat protein
VLEAGDWAESLCARYYFVAVLLGKAEKLERSQQLVCLGFLLDQDLGTKWGIHPDIVASIRLKRVGIVQLAAVDQGMAKSLDAVGTVPSAYLAAWESDLRELSQWRPAAAIEGSPENDAAMGMANTLYRAKRYADAAQAYQTYLERIPYSPRRAKAIINIGKCSVMRQEYKEAKQTILRALLDDPEGPEADRARKYVSPIYIHPVEQ